MAGVRILPILFNTNMVRAILDNRKKVTRRLVKPQPNGTVDLHWEGFYKDDEWILLKEPYRPGDILYVRETFRIDYLSNIIGTGRVHYKADGSFADIRFAPNRYDMMRRAQLKPGWRANENMPREAARIFLRVTDVRVERLQEINMFSILREGVVPVSIKGGDWEQWQNDYMKPAWDSTIKPADRERYGWAANPWVWVIKFERCEKPEDWPKGSAA